MRILAICRLMILFCLLVCMRITQSSSTTVSDLKSELGTLAFAGLDFYKNTINLTPLQYNDQDNQIPNMLIDDYKDGFIVAHGLDYYIGIGPATTWFFENITNVSDYLWKYVGLALVIDRGVEFMSYVGKKEDIKAIKKQKRIPYFATDMLGWKEGDSVFFQSAGGIAFTGKIGAYGFGIGPTFVVSGSWGTYVEKMEDNKVFVQQMQGEAGKAHLVAGTYIAEISCGLIKELTKGFSYVYDLNNQDAAKAYEDMLKGNVIPTQRMSEGPSNSFIIKVDSFDKAKQSRVQQFSMGIPFLNYTAKREKYFEHVTRILDLNDKTTETYFAGNFAQTYGHVLNRHRITRVGFYTGLKVDNNEEERQFVDYAGTFNWYYSSDHSSPRKLNRALKRLFKKTGLESELGANFPNEKKLKYTAITYNLNLPSRFINYMMKMHADKLLLEQYKHDTQRELEHYFENQSDPYNLCLAHITKIDWLGCKSMHKQSLRHSFKKMGHSLDTMRDSMIDREQVEAEESSYKEFVRGFTEFGNTFVQNIFLFNTVYADAQKCGLETSYKIEGERLSRYLKEKKYKIEKSCIGSL